uniref:Enhancer of split mbeta protein-like n=1 Tax=Hirondellea gigas TaxID=1518452 RepID=A0A6A7G7J1_9CRUS
MVSSINVETASRSDQYKRVMKPLLERKRRARINRCLDELRDLLVSVLQAEGEAVTRLEKADILELTVRHVRRLSQRRRLALPTPGVKHQDREDVVKFQEGFVAAAQQVQNFLLSSNLEPTVSSRLISHLSSYATSITPPPPTTTPASNPPSNVHPQSAQRSNHPVAPAPHQPAPQSAPAHPPVHHQQPSAPQFVVNNHTSPNAPPIQYAVPQQNKPQQPIQQQHHIRPVSTNTLMPPAVSSSNKSIVHPSLQQQPLIDLSNRPSPANNVSAPIIRDVKYEDRKIAPSPFIDVVSTENDFHSQHKINTQNIKLESSVRNNPITNNSRVTVQLQAKVVASISVSEAHIRTAQSDSFKNHMYALATQHRQVLSAERSSTPAFPQDLSMKKPINPDDGSPSWRPW